MENYFPTRIFFRNGNFPDMLPFIKDSEKIFLVISKTLRQKRPDIVSQIPHPLEIFSEVGINPSLMQLQQVEIPHGTTQVIGIGGGSKLDAAKAIFARVMTEDKYSLKELIE